jgi:glycosyltransferase involved in cell wall biosynthesis
VTDPEKRHYAGFAGRFSHEKGISTLLDACRITGLPFKFAGDHNSMPELVSTSPRNVTFLGKLNRTELASFYSGARFLVVPSIWFETLGLVAAEAMGHATPVIASRIGALRDVVEDGVTGLLFEPGNAEELAQKMTYLWDHFELCRKFGLAGRAKRAREYGEDKHFEGLMAVYERVMK